MKIVFISSGDPVQDTYPSGGGIQHQIWGLAKELTEKGHETHILSRYDKGQEYQLLDGINIHKIKVAPSDAIISKLILSKKMRKKVLEIKPDIMYLSDIFTSTYLLKMDITTIYTTHNTYLDSQKRLTIQTNKLNFFLFDIKQKMEERVMKNSDIILATNNTLEKWLKSKGLSNTFLFPHAVDPEIYQNTADDKFIFYAGQFRRRKGVNYLLDAFDCLQSKFDDYHLVLRGFAQDKKKLIKRASNSIKKDKIKFLPYATKEELIKDYSRCSVFIYPSIYESFGIAIIEAMASGKVVIASKIPGPQDIITDGKNGILFEVGNIRELKRDMELILADAKLRNKIGKNARKTVEKNYSFHEISKKLIKILEQSP